MGWHGRGCYIAEARAGSWDSSHLGIRHRGVAGGAMGCPSADTARYGSRLSVRRGAPHRSGLQPLSAQVTNGLLAEIDCSLDGGEVDVGGDVGGPVVIPGLLEAAAAAEGRGLVAGG